MYSLTTATKKIDALTRRIRIIQGGTSASKTVSVILYLIARAQSDKNITLTSIVSESFPHLRRGVMRDFETIMREHQYFKEYLWDKTNSVYTFENGSKIEFFSVDQPEKVRGARRDRLFINECNNVSFAAFEELEVRTKEFIIVDFNPTNEFWVFTDILGKRNDIDHIILTYKDNEPLSQEIVKSIESRKDRKGWWQVYGLGQLGEVEGIIYKGWQVIKEIPHEARLERYGIDFGYSVDPTAICAVYYYNGGYIVDEIAFQKELSGKQIADILLNQPRKALAIADSADPRLIDEIRTYGVNIQPTVKGKDSVRQGIQAIQEQQISMTERSVNIHKAVKNYMWATDRLGNFLSPNEPDHLFSDLPDSIRYAMTSLIPMIRRKEMIDSLPRYEQKERVNTAF